MRLPIIALTVSAFAIGTTEFVVMGLQRQIATNLTVDIPSAGMLVSGYALGVVFGNPIVAMLTAKLPRKTILILLMSIFILGNILCPLAPNQTLAHYYYASTSPTPNSALPQPQSPSSAYYLPPTAHGATAQTQIKTPPPLNPITHHYKKQPSYRYSGIKTSLKAKPSQPPPRCYLHSHNT